MRDRDLRSPLTISRRLPRPSDPSHLPAATGEEGPPGIGLGRRPGVSTNTVWLLKHKFILVMLGLDEGPKDGSSRVL